MGTECWRLRDIRDRRQSCSRSRSQPVEVRMNSYDIYSLYEGTRSVGKRSVECRDDLDALAAAKQQSAKQAVEVWEGNRFVARVKQNDAELTAEDAQSL